MHGKSGYPDVMFHCRWLAPTQRETAQIVDSFMFLLAKEGRIGVIGLGGKTSLVSWQSKYRDELNYKEQILTSVRVPGAKQNHESKGIRHGK